MCNLLIVLIYFHFTCIYVCRPEYIFCLAFICLFVFLSFWLNSLGVNLNIHTHISTCVGGWNTFGWRFGCRSHVWEGEVHTRLDIFLHEHGMCVFIGSIDMCEDWNKIHPATGVIQHYFFVTQTGFWFLGCYATTQLATKLPQRRIMIQVVRSNRVARGLASYTCRSGTRHNTNLRRRWPIRLRRRWPHLGACSSYRRQASASDSRGRHFPLVWYLYFNFTRVLIFSILSYSLIQISKSLRWLDYCMLTKEQAVTFVWFASGVPWTNTRRIYLKFRIVFPTRI